MLLGAVLGLGALQAPAASATFLVTIDTSALSGTSALIAFDLVDGDESVNNAIFISGFASDGVYVPSEAVLVGDVAGDLDTGVVLGDDGAFNELAQPITLGDSISFRLDSSNHFSGSGVYDRFTLFLLDPITYQTLYDTADPTGSNALMGFDLTGAALAPDVYAPTSSSGAVLQIASSVPEPPVWALCLLGALAVRQSLKTVRRL